MNRPTESSNVSVNHSVPCGPTVIWAGKPATLAGLAVTAERPPSARAAALLRAHQLAGDAAG